jgi:hypothetical protein
MWMIWNEQSFQMTELRLSLPTYLLGIEAFSIKFRS